MAGAGAPDAHGSGRLTVGDPRVDHRPVVVSGGEALVDLVPDPVPGGGPMNVAIAAARLGGRSAFVGAISTDDHGRMIRDHLEANGVDLSLCSTVDAPTARAIVEHTPELVFRFEGEGTADTLLDDVDPTLLGSSRRIVHGGTLGLFRGKTAETLATLAEWHDGLVSLDPNVRPSLVDDRDRWDHFHDRWLVSTDLYKGSDEDLDWVWPGRSSEAVADELIDRGIGAVVVTRGSEGLTIFCGRGEVSVDAPPVDVVDTVGAGDTIVAALLVSLTGHPAVDRGNLDGVTLADWQRFGTRAVGAAAITCSRPGADPPTRAEIQW